MLSRNLLLGASLLAFAAGNAAAQTGNNRSSASVTGTGNEVAVSNNAAGNEENNSDVTVNGESNQVIVEQVGDFNVSRVRQTGSNNVVVHRQRGDRNRAESEQTGNQHESRIRQQGDANVGTVVQANGDRSFSAINQGTTSAANGGGPPIAGNRNSAQVTQRGSDNESIVNQRDTGNTAPGTQVSDNRATVVQGTAERRSNGAFSFIQQESRGNIAEMFQFEGAFPAPQGSAPTNNGAFIIQRHFGAVNTPDPTASTLSNNRGSIAMRGFGNAAGIFQNGRDNNAEVTVLGGGTATNVQTDPETNRSQGNSSFVDQSGTALTALAVGGSILATEGQGNFSNTQQRGNNHRLEIYQRGVLDTNLIAQSNGVNTATYSDGATPRAFASVSQRGVRNSSSVTQVGDNFAEVTQGFGARSSVTVSQTDAGDFGGGFQTNDPNNPFDNTTSSGTRAFNTGLIAQFGDSQLVELTQNAVQASATIFQERFTVSGSTTNANNNAARVRQGANAVGQGTSGVNNSRLTANVVQSGRFNSGTVQQEGNRLTATVEQRGAFRLSNTSTLRNLVTVSQTGSDNTARAFQSVDVGASGTDAPASNAMTNNAAAQGFFRSGGTQSPEIQIIQSNTGNSATVEQFGRGQFARIEQTGARNTAAIFQRRDATNATAVIRQSGNGNTFRVEQTAAGQFIFVDQTGNNNSATNVTQGGPAGGSSGTGL